ncbi:hypothetical protein HY992_06520 [Candidatus Micrarchaeota archaeon]|nr:hypothetical protein [Candidatus Micrarchaeota archaeon]
MKCQKCGVPLKGLRAMICKHVFGVKRSEKHPHLCNKCEPKACAKPAAKKKKKGKR